MQAKDIKDADVAAEAAASGQMVRAGHADSADLKVSTVQNIRICIYKVFKTQISDILTVALQAVRIMISDRLISLRSKTWSR